MSQVQYLVEAVVYDPALPGTRTLRYATVGFVTGPAETPANTWYDERVVEAGDVSRSIAESAFRGVNARPTVGDVVLNNADGGLDALAGYAFDGRAITIRRGAIGAAYPSGFTTVFVGTMDDCEVTRATVRIRLRDNLLKLTAPLQTTTYDGDNALPDGLEGVEGDLKGKRKPLLFGTAKNLPVPCVNTAKLIYQVSDSAIDDVTAALDRGVKLGDRRYAVLGASGEAKFAKWPEQLPTEQTTGLWSSGNGQCAIYALDLWIVGTSTGIWTSPDFITWTQRENNTAINPNGLAFDGTTVVAVGAAGEIWTSTNGTSWTERTSGVSTSLIEVAHDGAGLFVACGDEGVILTSPTGTTWTARTSPYTDATDAWRFVVYSPDLALWCVVGGDALAPAPLIATSPDGTTWTARTAPGSSQLYGVAWGNGRFVAVGSFASTPIVAMISSDGTTWTEYDFPFVDALTTFTGFTAITFDEDQFVAVTIAGEVLTSSYGSTWTVVHRNPAGNTFSARAVAFKAPAASGTYADLTELVDDDLAPEPGTYKWVSHADGSYIRLGSPPAGLITVDASQGATAADRTAGQLFAAVLTRAGFTSSDWSTSDVTALDSADNSELGFWSFDDEMTVEEAIDLIAASVGAYWTTDAAGLYRIAQLTAPSGTPVLVITENDVTRLERLPSERPSYRTTLRYARFYAVQPTDVALGVTDARRAELAKEWREAFDEDASVQTAHLLAVATVEDSLYAAAADAEAEATRRQTLRGTKATRLSCDVKLTADTEALDLGDVVTVEHSRFGLSAGVDFRVVGLATRRKDRKLTIDLWSNAA